ncbi:hypothetical protein GEMRC1_003343 [Eukaryota sp. GEM-RC1]
MSTRGYACTNKDCDAVFGTKDGLRKHITAKHSTKFQCSECSKTLNSAYNLRQHMLIHTGEKPHECEGCHQPFTQKGALTIHRRRCKALNSKPDHQYQCGVPGCEHVTTTINTMWQHLNFRPSQPVKVHADLPPEERTCIHLPTGEVRVHHLQENTTSMTPAQTQKELSME